MKGFLRRRPVQLQINEMIVENAGCVFQGRLRLLERRGSKLFATFDALAECTDPQNKTRRRFVPVPGNSYEMEFSVARILARTMEELVLATENGETLTLLRARSPRGLNYQILAERGSVTQKIPRLP